LLTCAYHGVQVDEFGKVARVPAMANCPLEGKKLVRDYPVIEHYQAIWAYFGDDQHLAPTPMELPLELVSPEWSGMLHFDTWDAHYRYIYDNLCDPMHGPYLHAKTYTLSGGSQTDQVVVNKTEQGFATVRVSQKRGNIDLLEFVDNASTCYTRVEVPLPPTAGPGDLMRIIFWVTPIDENHTQIYGWRLRKVSGWQRDLWHFLFKVRLRHFTNAVLAQDKAALAAMPPWPPVENLYQHDLGVARVRKHIRDEAETQARAFATARS
jgi:phenylpropionate dioxygenase-like ring-hydroxylating dioxygenase large terminal subunit